MDIKRLNLGASRLEKLPKESLEVFLDKTWFHLGDKNLSNPNNKELIPVDYSLTNFKEFFFSRGGSLPFKANFFTHIFSEHFFEHFSYQENEELLQECYRTIKPSGFIRIVVPDADLRPIPEIEGFPGKEYPSSSPQKHKTRWSVYSMKEILSKTGFKPIPIKYYDKNRILHDCTRELPLKEHNQCIDKEMVSNISHIKRKNSLIIDGIK